ncbi:DUF982 domain-containing protein [Rhizobium phaseoli]|uniref:DUF982 domain-containing protein n=1 Tax=Rhizobium phaseoli TaxID=396 RepID=UPI003CCAADEB
MLAKVIADWCDANSIDAGGDCAQAAYAAAVDLLSANTDLSGAVATGAGPPDGPKKAGGTFVVDRGWAKRTPVSRIARRRSLCLVEECRYSTSSKVDHCENGKTAFYLLSARWPVSHGKAYIAALEACEGVGDGPVSDESAQELFLLALREAVGSVHTAG